MTSKTTLYLLASEDAFAIYAGRAPRALELLATRQAAEFGDVLEEPTSEKTRGSTGQVSFNVGPELDAQSDRQRLALAAHAWQALDGIWPAGGHDRIVLAAGPKMLGALRAQQPTTLADYVSGELGKNLMNVPPQELPAHLGAEP